MRQWFHLLPLPLAGYAFEEPLSSNLLPTARGVGIAFCVLAFGYLLNAVADREMDLDRRKNPLAAIGTTSQTLLLPLALLAGISLALAATASVWVIAFTMICLASGSFYSVGPRLKSLPLVGTLMNLTNFLPLMFVGMPQPTPSSRLIALAVCFSALLLQNQLIHEAGDAPEDRRGGVRTTFLQIGARWTAAVVMICGWITLLTTVWAARLFGLPELIGLHALPYVLVFPGLLLMLGDQPKRMKATRHAQRWCAAASGALLFFGLR